MLFSFTFLALAGVLLMVSNTEHNTDLANQQTMIGFFTALICFGFAFATIPSIIKASKPKQKDSRKK